MLNTIEHGTIGAGPSLLIAHGLFGSARNWGAIAKRLGQDRHVVVVDMRNHGMSGWFDTNSYEDMAADLAQVIGQMPGGVADVLGHSMGGKAAMMLAVTMPHLVHRLVVADIAPVAYTHTQAHLITAMRQVNPSQIQTRQQATAALGVDDPGIAAFLLQSLDIKAGKWRLNLDVLATEMDAIIGFPGVQGQFDRPTLFLTGETSDYVQQAHRTKIKAMFSDVRFAKLKGAGHWLHAEKPRAFEQVLRGFLETPSHL